MTAYEKSKELFPDQNRLRRINVIVEAVDDNLLTTAAFNEIMEFEKILYQVSEFSDTKLNNFNEIERDSKGKLFKFADICPVVVLTNPVTEETFEKCVTDDMPLDFIYDFNTNSYRMDKYDTDQKLVAQIQTGKGDPTLYEGAKYLFIDGIFAETDPNPV